MKNHSDEVEMRLEYGINRMKEVLGLFKKAVSTMFLYDRSSVGVVSKLKELTEQVDYMCDFEDGVCKEYRHCVDRPVTCCCKSCFVNFGYLECEYELNVTSRRQIKRASTLFDQNGFWSPGGCKLPRVDRSGICLSYNCAGSGLKSLLSRRDDILLNIIKWPLATIAAYDSYVTNIAKTDRERNIENFLEHLPSARYTHDYTHRFLWYRLERPWGCWCNVCNKPIETEDLIETVNTYPDLIEKGDTNTNQLTASELLLYDGRVHLDCVDEL